MSKQILPYVIDFLARLRRIDKRGLTLRDVLVLYAVIESPGASGLDVANKLGIKERSAISSNLARLQREGFIEDRREQHGRAIPALLYALPAGVAFWEEIKPSE